MRNSATGGTGGKSGIVEVASPPFLDRFAPRAGVLQAYVVYLPAQRWGRVAHKQLPTTEHLTKRYRYAKIAPLSWIPSKASGKEVIYIETIIVLALVLAIIISAKI
jgi:hypothetical protein